MDFEKLDYEGASKVVVAKIRQKEQDFIPAGLAVLQDPVLGKNPEVHRWIASLPCVMGGNNAWHQEVTFILLSHGLALISYPRVADIILVLSRERFRSRIFLTQRKWPGKRRLFSHGINSNPSTL
jgi:hypothetical protein